MAMTCFAPSRIALRMVICPTGPQPQIATVSVGWMSHCTAACQPVGKDVAQEQHLLIGKAVRGYLDVRLVGVRHPDIFRLAAGVAAGEMGVSEQARRRVAEHLVGDVFVPVGSLADREVAASALLAFAADDRERDDDAVADLQACLLSGPTSTTSPMNSWPMTSPFSMPGM